MGNKRIKRGFTVLELLVVIAIIGLLSSMVMVAMNDARQKARATTIVNDLKAIDTAFRIKYVQQDHYPDESEYGLGTNPNIEALITNGHLNEYFSVAPQAPVGNTGNYKYDSDFDNYDSIDCSVNGDEGRGVNILLWGISTTTHEYELDYLDKVFDNRDGLSCGRIRFHSNALLYLLSDTRDEGP